MRYLLERNFSCWLMCIFFLIFILLDNSFEKKIRRYFAVICISTIVLSIVECVDYTYAQRMNPTFIRQLTTSVIYMLRTFVIYYMSKIVDRDGEYNTAFSFPFLAIVLLLIVNIPSGIVFAFSDVNQLVWGPFSIMIVLVYIFYFALMVIFTVKYAYNSKANEQVIVLFIIVGSSVSMFIESTMHSRFLLNSTLLVCAVMYYLFLHTHIYKRDELTKLYNRRNFYLDVEDLQKKEPFIVVSIDLNNLKYINDNYGHKEGDRAITTVVKEINRHMTSGCSLYRVGGDEFMMICRKMKYYAVEKMLNDVDLCLDYTPYSVAYGIAMYTLDSDFNKVMNMADQKMYDNKKMKKEQEKNSKKKKIIISENEE